jgi:GH43 family beta-xylosidase
MLADFFPKKYLNPVYPHSFPDPYVLKFCGEYYAFCTDFAPDGKVFNILRSRDLVNWREIGGAMTPLPSNPPFYWAPEVFYHNGKFYLYYSVGNETLMEIRAAISDRPDGGFVDSGRRLTTEDFAIDAHVFEDTGGERYLFYATDFLTHTHIGTGTVVDRMIDLLTLEGNPRPVTRARYDWQIYDPNRKEKGGARWHTVEGATVLKRKGVYYEMFSGGNWQNITYGVSFAVADDINQPEEWQQFSDGEKIYPILRTVPGTIVGPGHNSVVRGVNNRELYCIYHRWTENGRVLAIDRMDFAGGNRMFIHGATHTLQPAPFEPQALDYFDELSSENWRVISGVWSVRDNQIIAESGEKSEIVCAAEAESYLCEVWLKTDKNSTGQFGVCLKNSEREVVKFLFLPNEKRIAVVWFENGVEQTEISTLANVCDFESFHLLRIETDELFVKITLDENRFRFEKFTETIGNRIALIAENSTVAFSGFALTRGYEERFENENLEKKGWRKMTESGEWKIENQNLFLASRNETETIICRGTPEENYEFAVNFRLEEISSENGSFGFYPAYDENTPTPYFLIEKTNAGQWVLSAKIADETKLFTLPENFSPEVFRQISFVKIAGKIVVTLETETLGIVDAPPIPTVIALSVRNAAVVFDMARVTVL